jgi:hypothetical protein
MVKPYHRFAGTVAGILLVWLGWDELRNPDAFVIGTAILVNGVLFLVASWSSVVLSASKRARK